MIKTIWGWREEGPELLDAWDEIDVDANWDGWQEALKNAFAKTQVSGSGFWKEVGIRVFDMRFDGALIEKAFMEHLAEASIVPGDKKHPLVAFAERLAAMDDPNNEAAADDRSSVTLEALIESAKLALDDAEEIGMEMSARGDG